MRQESLCGYMLHARPYQEKRSIYHCLTLEWGLVQGVGSRGVPNFVLVQLLAKGKNTLKSFGQIHLVDEAYAVMARGQEQYALLYLNEILCKLLAPESPCSMLFYHYQKAIHRLLSMSEYSNEEKMQQIKLCLRQFERVLFDELGVSIDFLFDSMGQAIIASDYYQFVPDEGFKKIHPDQPLGSLTSRGQVVAGMVFGGWCLMQMADDKNLPKFLGEYTNIHRQLLDFLLDYKPLNSRKLWLESMKYQSR